METCIAYKNVRIVVRKPYTKPQLVEYGNLAEMTRTTREYGLKSDNSKCIKNKTG